MRRVLVGLDTEYGFSVEGRGVSQQVEDASEFVSAYPGECFVGWDDIDESPRADLRGFESSGLLIDPDDAKFDHATEPRSVHAVRCDRILTNGARLYNDHGHPEYATPECLSVGELLLHDRAGDLAILACATCYETVTGREVSVFKNNTDFHGASYGSHESYLVPREIGFERLYQGLIPLFVARQVLTGAGKVGSEDGADCEFQISQRADFLNELASVDTLYKRPIFNTRDEPHGDREQWIRLHVICGESNMSPTALKIKIGLVKIALRLIETGKCPRWELSNPVRTIKEISRNPDDEGRIELQSKSSTTPRHIIESYLDVFEGDDELNIISSEARRLLDARFLRPDEFALSVDWAAKKKLLDQYRDSEGTQWQDPIMRSLDLEYHRLDDRSGLYYALVEQGQSDPEPSQEQIQSRLSRVHEPTRAMARSLAVTKFKSKLVSANWSCLVLATSSDQNNLNLPPEMDYPDSLADANHVEEFIMAIEELQR